MLLRARCLGHHTVSFQKIEVWCLSCPGIGFIPKQNDFWHLQQEERAGVESVANWVRWGEDYQIQSIFIDEDITARIRIAGFHQVACQPR